MLKQKAVKVDAYQPIFGTSSSTGAPARPHALADYQSEDELAEELDRSSRTLARWRAANTGPPYVEIGRQILYRRTAVAEWLLRRERGGFVERKRGGRG
jgi:hypothetical protein